MLQRHPKDYLLNLIRSEGFNPHIFEATVVLLKHPKHT